ncbi:hypothetical protein MK805_16655 [Shimazuella sp. AN120528]|uniref:hypothetical protein n=1 Tax=Shimazuella soli TaxID=1892854 RepID=UPI001F0F9C4D|nr:hypothetical protein [Shimazuella soli]MCH5586571.1 hypothetical protein [Shimazuella soli]
MKKSIITESNKHITLQISKDDLIYTIQELEKLHEEGGQFSLRVQKEQDTFLLFQKVKIDEDNHTEVIYKGTEDSIWSPIIFFAVCLFCFIAVLYVILHFLM